MSGFMENKMLIEFTSDSLNVFQNKMLSTEGGVEQNFCRKSQQKWSNISGAATLEPLLVESQQPPHLHLGRCSFFIQTAYSNISVCSEPPLLVYCFLFIGFASGLLENDSNIFRLMASAVSGL